MEFDGDPKEFETLWRPVFYKYDVNNDGRIPLSYLKNVLKSNVTHDFPDEVVDEIVEMAEINDDGKLNYDEFLKMVEVYKFGKLHPTFKRIVRVAALAVMPKSQQAMTVRRHMEELNTPIFTPLISCIQLGMYISECIDLKGFGATGPVRFDSSLIYHPSPRKRVEVWRYITYMFVHAGAVHMFFNLLVQLLLGIPLEMVHKSRNVMYIYIGGVLTGCLASTMYDNKTILVGASGGAYALIAAHLINVNFREMTFAKARLIGLLIFGGADVGVAVYSRYAIGTPHTSYAAHFGGMLAGLLLGIKKLRSFKLHEWEKILGQVLFLGFIFLMVFLFFLILREHFYLMIYEL